MLLEDGWGFSLYWPAFQVKPFTKLCFSSDNPTRFGYKNPVATRITKCITLFFAIPIFITEEMMCFSSCLPWFSLLLLSSLLGNSTRKCQELFLLKPKRYWSIYDNINLWNIFYVSMILAIFYCSSSSHISLVLKMLQANIQINPTQIFLCFKNVSFVMHNHWKVY